MSPRITLTQSNRYTWRIFAAVWLAIFAGVLWWSSNAAHDRALKQITEQARIDAHLNIALLRAFLDKQRTLPLVLSMDPELKTTLQTPTPELTQPLNLKLEALAQGAQAAVIYLLSNDGKGIAASNWHSPDSFVGTDYAFRPYFSQAMENGHAEYFAFGNVSNRPGLYISRRIDGDNGPLGVIVVKLSFDQLENDWRNTGRTTFVVGEQDTVLITSRADWRFHSLGQLSPDALKRIQDSLQFGHEPIKPLPLTLTPSQFQNVLWAHLDTSPKAINQDQLAVRSAVPTTPWHLYNLTPTRQVLAAAVREARLQAFVLLAALALLTGWIVRRRQLSLAHIANAQREQQELERRVEERTLALRQARDRLEAEIKDHHHTEKTLQGVQQNLVHANRLAILGQIAAGVAHEINQPVATIRVYADNAQIFLARQQLDTVRENLTEIASLTERIGTITGDLKALARKGRTPSAPVSLRKVFLGAQVLLRSRFAGDMEQLDVALPPESLLVVGHSVRLEQVMINLLQNALEAVADQGKSGLVAVRWQQEEERVIVTVADNGPGMPEEILDQLFTPFNTSKEHGLGLGLVIAKEIITDYGGRISVQCSASGTVFSVELRAAL